MTLGRTTTAGLAVTLGLSAGLVFAQARAALETFSATASVKSAAGAAATAPVTIEVTRVTPADEAEKLVSAFKTGGAAALRKALAGTAATGSVRIGSGKPTPTRITVERTTDKGRLLTIVTDAPVLFVGGSLPNAPAKAGHDFAVIDIEVDKAGNGSGTLQPAATIKLSNGAFVVDDYGSELVRLVNVKRAK